MKPRIVEKTRGAVAMGLLLGLVAVIAASHAAGEPLTPATPPVPVVGFEKIRVPNGSEAPLDGGVWYPAAGRESTLRGPWPGVISDAALKGNHLPLIVLSHGGGGSYAGHYDTAIALARAGFVVAAVSHAGDTYYDQSKVMQLWRRPQQLHALISYMLEQWPHHRLLDGKRVGAFGFSNGGFTVLVAAGGVPDLSRVGPYCQSHPTHDLCTAMRQAGVDPNDPPIHVPRHAWTHDARIKAVAAAAPAFGFTFGKRGLRNIRVPVQLWHAQDDRHQPNPYYEAAVRAALPVAPDYRVVPGAGHYDFLPPCDQHLAAANPQICSDPPAFDRAAFHAQLNATLARFFRTHL